MIDLIRRIFRRDGVDRTLYLCAFILTVFGIIMIGSASIGQSASHGATYATINMVKQAVFVLIGYGIMIFFARCFKTKWIDNTNTWILYIIGIILLLVCLFWSSKGSHAWIKIGRITIQTSEFMKIFMILFLSFHFGEIEELCIINNFMSKKQRREMLWKKFQYCIIFPIIAIFVAFFVIAVIQKDLGSALIFAFICLVLFFITPRPYYARYKKIVLIILGFIGIIGIFSLVIVLKGYQLQRIDTWLNPLKDPRNAGWQLVNSLIAFTKGGLLGRGFGASTQKFGYIPESHNDFIAAIIFEELGVLGLGLFMIPYCIIIYKMFYYGMAIKDTKSKMILYGIGTYFFTHLLVNLGGVSGFIPMTGVPLLLISSGGSSTLAAMLALGIAQSIISKYNRNLIKEQIQ